MPGNFYKLEQTKRKKVVWKYQDLILRIFGTSKARYDANQYFNKSDFRVQMMLTRILNDWNRKSYTPQLGYSAIRSEAIPIIKRWIIEAKDYEIKEVLQFLMYLSREDELGMLNDNLSNSDDGFYDETAGRVSSNCKSELSIADIIAKTNEIRASRASNFSESQVIFSSNDQLLSRNSESRGFSTHERTKSAPRMQTRFQEEVIEISPSSDMFLSQSQDSALSIRESSLSDRSTKLSSRQKDILNIDYNPINTGSLFHQFTPVRQNTYIDVNNRSREPSHRNDTIWDDDIENKSSLYGEIVYPNSRDSCVDQRGDQNKNTSHEYKEMNQPYKNQTLPLENQNQGSKTKANQLNSRKNTPVKGDDNNSTDLLHRRSASETTDFSASGYKRNITPQISNKNNTGRKKKSALKQSQPKNNISTQIVNNGKLHYSANMHKTDKDKN